MPVQISKGIKIIPDKAYLTINNPHLGVIAGKYQLVTGHLDYSFVLFYSILAHENRVNGILLGNEAGEFKSSLELPSPTVVWDFNKEEISSINKIIEALFCKIYSNCLSACEETNVTFYEFLTTSEGL